VTTVDANNPILEQWPRLSLADWSPTYETLHRWIQIAGKTRLRLAPFENHWWHCALYLSSHGLTTSPMPWAGDNVEIEFDFLNDLLIARVSDGRTASLRLEEKAVADFYREYMAMLAELGIDIRIHSRPNEVPDAPPFSADRKHATYDGAAVRRWWRIVSGADRVLKAFRGAFGGKCSPTHLWWGALDLACTRFSGRGAPPHPGGIPNLPDFVTREAYSRECISAGFWPGTVGGPVAEPAFYAYAYPEPNGCHLAPIRPSAASYNAELHEWILPYDAVRGQADADGFITEFLESTYHAAATLGKWDIDWLQAVNPCTSRILATRSSPP
jgi:Family of unknown function (DUF5996)